MILYEFLHMFWKQILPYWANNISAMQTYRAAYIVK